MDIELENAESAENIVFNERQMLCGGVSLAKVRGVWQQVFHLPMIDGNPNWGEKIKRKMFRLP